MHVEHRTINLLTDVLLTNLRHNAPGDNAPECSPKKARQQEYGQDVVKFLTTFIMSFLDMAAFDPSLGHRPNGFSLPIVCVFDNDVSYNRKRSESLIDA